MLVMLGTGDVRRLTALRLSLPTRLSFSLLFFVLFWFGSLKTLKFRNAICFELWKMFGMNNTKTWIAVEHPEWLGRGRHGTRLEQRKAELVVF